MKNSEVYDNIMKRLGSRSSPTLRVQTVFELNRIIDLYEQGPVLPYFLESEWEANTVANQRYLVLPTDFLRQPEDGLVRLENADGLWGKLTKKTIGKLNEEAENATDSLPEIYALYGKRVYFGPAPDAVYALRLPYYRRTDEVPDTSDEVTNDWLLEYYNLITLETIDFVARTHTRDVTVVKLIADELRVAQDTYWRSVEARENAEYTRLLNDEED